MNFKAYLYIGERQSNCIEVPRDIYDRYGWVNLGVLVIGVGKGKYKERMY